MPTKHIFEYIYFFKLKSNLMAKTLCLSRLPQNLGLTKQLVQSFVGLWMEIGLNGI